MADRAEVLMGTGSETCSLSSRQKVTYDQNESALHKPPIRMIMGLRKLNAGTRSRQLTE